MSFGENVRLPADEIHARGLHATPEGVILEERSGPVTEMERPAEKPDDFSESEGRLPLELALRDALPNGIGTEELDRIKAFLETIQIPDDSNPDSVAEGGLDMDSLKSGGTTFPNNPEGHSDLLQAIRNVPSVRNFLSALAVFYSLTAGTGTAFASDREMRDIQKAGSNEYDRRTARFYVDRQLNGQERFQQGIIRSERQSMEASRLAAMKRKEFVQGMYRFVDDLRAIEDEYRLNFERGMSQNFPNENARNQTEVRLNRTYLFRVIELENRIKKLSSEAESAAYQAPRGLFSGNSVEKFLADMHKMMALALERSGETKKKFSEALGGKGIVIPRNALDAVSKGVDPGGAETLSPGDQELLKSLLKK